jgi:hypothetical protein
MISKVKHQSRALIIGIAVSVTVTASAEVINLANMKQRLSAAEAKNDAPSIRYWTNVIYLHQNLRKAEVVSEVWQSRIDSRS